MNTSSILRILGTVLLWLLLSAGLGIYTGVTNSFDRSHGTINSSHLDGEVKVYRDENGIPTIIGKTIEDVLYAQGYEYARDRAFQLEFTRAIANGELSTIIGTQGYSSDVFLRHLMLKESAENVAASLTPEIRNYMTSYLRGLNRYIADHENNQPFELQLLGAKMKEWELADIIAVQGVMAFDLAFRGGAQELIVNNLISQIGVNRTIEYLDFQNPDVIAYLRTINETDLVTSDSWVNPLEPVLGENGMEYGIGSNNWVIGGEKTLSGNPIVANDPHLGLTTPGIWWLVNLVATEDNFHVQGYSLPGIPFVIVGHNEYVAWGVTNTGTDAVDLFYLNRNDTHYLVGNEWKKITKLEQKIQFSDGTSKPVTINVTEFGPLMKFGDNEYAVKWTLHEGYDRDRIVDSVFMINTAENIFDIHDALEFWAVPGQNFVMADTEGNIGYQYTGIVPIRNTGYGVIPHNGSSGEFGWEGVEPYDKQLWLPNPTSGYFGTANQRIDTREIIYITEMYAPGMRGKRLNQLLKDGSGFTVDDVQEMQMDAYTLGKDYFLDPFLSDISVASYPSVDADILKEAISEISFWDGNMYRNSTGALIHMTYQMYFLEQTILDELGQDLTTRTHYYATNKIGEYAVNDSDNVWFDDLNTTDVETAKDIAIRAFGMAVDYLISKYGEDVSKWKWGEAHQVTFEHRLGSVLSFLNTGPKPSDGEKFTLNAGGGVNYRGRDEFDFSQTHGPSMRFIAEVEETWSNVVGVLPVGETGHPFDRNYDNFFDDWIEGNYYSWIFTQDAVEQNMKITREFRREE